MVAEPNIIEVAAGEVAEELRRRGISSDERVTLLIEPEKEVIPGRRASRTRVVAAGLTDDDIDRLIKQAQSEVALIGFRGGEVGTMVQGWERLVRRQDRE